MEHYKISKLLNNSAVSKFVTKRCIEVNDLSSAQYFVNKIRTFKTSMLSSDLCDYSNAYIVVKVAITIEGYRSCISQINNSFIGNAEDLDIARPMYNLLEYNDYSMTSGSLWNYYGDEINHDANENNAASNRIKNNKTITCKYFKYKTKLIGSTPNNNNILQTEVVVLLK